LGDYGWLEGADGLNDVGGDAEQIAEVLVDGLMLSDDGGYVDDRPRIRRLLMINAPTSGNACAMKLWSEEPVRTRLPQAKPGLDRALN
jgi:hypothetical protein